MPHQGVDAIVVASDIVSEMTKYCQPLYFAIEPAVLKYR